MHGAFPLSLVAAMSTHLAGGQYPSPHRFPAGRAARRGAPGIVAPRRNLAIHGQGLRVRTH
jgi:hypothetical protein